MGASPIPVKTASTKPADARNMTDYRRLFVRGGTYFFTVNTARAGSTLLTDNIDILRTVMAETQTEHPFRLDAIVILPDHLHTVMTLPPGDSNFPLIWNKIKGRFSRRLDWSGPRSRSKRIKRERGIWQRRYWEHLIRNPNDFRKHVEYCWINPVRHGLVQHVRDWPYCSFHRDVARGVASADFAGDSVKGEFGELAASQ